MNLGAAQELTDATLQSEIELYGSLVAAISDVEGPVTLEQLDAMLGLAPTD